MKTLILNPGASSLNYSLFEAGSGRLCSGRIEGYRGSGGTEASLHAVKEGIKRTLRFFGAVAAPDAIAIHTVFGGRVFKGPVIVDCKTENEIRSIMMESPLHVAGLLETTRGCGKVFPGIPAVIFFETSFFSTMPGKETSYAIDPGTSEKMGLYRYGYHGILHEAACSSAARKYKNNDMKIISICIEPRPELAAVRGMFPLMVTSGATPLEGLMGDRSCGDLDPGIIIKLSRELKWSIETINRFLTEESGVTGLAGEEATLESLFQKNTAPYRGARKMFLYQLLKASGSAIAALDGLDCIVISGRYIKAMKSAGEWLEKKISRIAAQNRVKPPWLVIYPGTTNDAISDRMASIIKDREKITSIK